VVIGGYVTRIARSNRDVLRLLTIDQMDLEIEVCQGHEDGFQVASIPMGDVPFRCHDIDDHSGGNVMIQHVPGSAGRLFPRRLGDKCRFRRKETGVSSFGLLGAEARRMTRIAEVLSGQVEQGVLFGALHSRFKTQAQMRRPMSRRDTQARHCD
jgi:hypothetical protein